MPRCDEMQQGEAYYCEECGLEIEVTEECSHDDDNEPDEVCSVDEFMCCGRPLTLRED